VTALDIDTPTLRWPPVEPMRDGYGRYAGAMVDDTEIGWTNPRSRVTTIVGKLEDRFNIERWMWECMARGLEQPIGSFIELVDDPVWARRLKEAKITARSPNLALLPLVNEHYESKEIRKFMERMGEAGGSKDASERGTRYHELVAMAIAQVKLPGDTTLDERRDIKAVLNLLHDAHIEVVDLERIVVSKEYDYAGTCDYRLMVPGAGLLIGDLKTGQRLDLSYAGYRAQLAAYAHAHHEVNDDGELVEVTAPVDRDLGMIVHLVPGTAHAELVGVDLVAGWRAFRLAHRVWTHVRGRPRPMSFDEGMIHLMGRRAERYAARSSWVRARIDVLRKIKSDPSATGVSAPHYLASIWPPGVPLPSQAIGWAGDDLEQVLAAVTVTETAFEAPFPPKDPTL
jgi:hypothetical protein